MGSAIQLSGRSPRQPYRLWQPVDRRLYVLAESPTFSALYQRPAAPLVVSTLAQSGRRAERVQGGPGLGLFGDVLVDKSRLHHEVRAPASH